MHTATELFIKALKELKTDITNDCIAETGAGICSNIEKIYHYHINYNFTGITYRELKGLDIIEVVSLMAMGWEHWSGVDSFPIKSSDSDLTAEGYYWYVENLWIGEQLLYRLSLIDYMLNNTDKLDQIITTLIKGEHS